MLIPQVWPRSSVLLFKGAGVWVAPRAAGQIRKRGGVGFSTSVNGKLTCCWPTLLKWQAIDTLFENIREIARQVGFEGPTSWREEKCREVKPLFSVVSCSRHFQSSEQQHRNRELCRASSRFRIKWDNKWKSGPTHKWSLGKQLRHSVELHKGVHPSSRAEPEIDPSSQRPKPSLRPRGGQIHNHLPTAWKED